MNQRLLNLLINRIAPEIVKAFHVEVAHCERFLISCYDEGGFFNRHRDNLDRANAHRQFAITINLNSDYEGGCLVFPEFGPHRYRPGAGEAVVFSGSLLHEAQPVTRGTRYAVLGFLYDAEAEARRQKYLAEAAEAKAASL
jgi:predicted 2-oxoglutarate/Fe(II)-dependent dioxygenase YbiX